jgi:transcriptional regulator of acetoin/glycerol metabolism
MEGSKRTNVFNMKETQLFIRDAVEKDYIIKALQFNKGNVMKSARELGLARQTLHRKMKKHGIAGLDYKV